MKKQTKRFLIPCAAAVFTIGASMMSFAAAGWRLEEDTWRFYDSQGEAVTEAWKKSGDSWFWLDEDGEMATETLVEYEEDHYYVDGNGVRVSNQWRKLDNTEDSDDGADTCWYYFGANGKAYKAPDSGKTSFKSIRKEDGTTRKYAFDSEGRMLYGWVNDESERQTDEDAWKNADYYLGGEDDGEMRANQWMCLEVEDDEQEDGDFEGWYWFYFKSNGKKIVDSTKTINGKKYRFEENGNAVFNWISTASNATATPGDMFYSQPADSWLSMGWFYTVPGESLDPEGYDTGDSYWYYATRDGEIVKSQIKKINGQYYAFDEYGKMLEGLYKMSVNDRQIQSLEEIESEEDLPEANDGWDVYYFGGSSKAGAMKTGTATIDLDGEKYYYSFKKSGDDRGKGFNGIEDGVIYEKGKRIEADRDEKYKVVTVELDDEDKDGDYLVNTSGKIQKNKKNTKDGDGTFYCTDGKGKVTYSGSEKWTAED